MSFLQRIINLLFERVSMSQSFSDSSSRNFCNQYIKTDNGQKKNLFILVLLPSAASGLFLCFSHPANVAENTKNTAMKMF